jgi:predicted MPP superfamily phosphohydrolase
LLGILRRVALRNGFFTMLGIVGISETLILQWTLITSGLSGFGWLAGVGLSAAFAFLNAATLMSLRALSWRNRPVYLLTRVYMIASLGALITGPILAAVFLASVVPAISGATSAAQATLVGGGAVAIGLGFGSMLWGYLVGQRRVVVDEVELPVRDLPPELEGLEIAHITDLHIGRQLRAPLLRRLVERVNGVGADLIVITGDIFDFDRDFIDEGCRELAALYAPLGVYAILGNHDTYTGREAVAEGLRRLTSIRLLRDEWTAVGARGARLYLLGLEDPGEGWTDRDCDGPELEKLCADAPADAPRILLAHRPAWFRQAQALDIPVMLAGHTHGGQISLPPPLHHHNIAQLIARWTRGRFEQGKSILYVNRGLGVAGPPVRLNCPREIARLRLTRRAVPSDGAP